MCYLSASGLSSFHLLASTVSLLQVREGCMQHVECEIVIMGDGILRLPMAQPTEKQRLWCSTHRA